MFKLFRRKLNKKGFTLAELLVVVAIIAILIAIAIPIFTKSMREAQLRTNQGNMRSVKAAGVTEILSDWGKYSKATADTIQANRTKPAQKWIITADVDNKGNISNVAVNGLTAAFDPKRDLDCIAAVSATVGSLAPGQVSSRTAAEGLYGGTTFAYKTELSNAAATICNVAADSNQRYVVLVYVTDVTFKS